MSKARPRRERKPFPPGFGTIWSTVALDLIGFGIVLLYAITQLPSSPSGPEVLDILLGLTARMRHERIETGLLSGLL